MSRSGNIILARATSYGHHVLSRAARPNRIRTSFHQDNHYIDGLIDRHAMIFYEVFEFPSTLQEHTIPHEFINEARAAVNTSVTKAQLWCYQSFLQVLPVPLYARANWDLIFCDELPRRQIQMEGDATVDPRRCWNLLGQGR